MKRVDIKYLVALSIIVVCGVCTCAVPLINYWHGTWLFTLFMLGGLLIQMSALFKLMVVTDKSNLYLSKEERGVL